MWENNSENIFVLILIKNWIHRRAIDKDIATTKGLQGLITQAIIVVVHTCEKKRKI